MRCNECGHSSPENHKFCGMCGSKLQPVAIDDNDPLEIDAPAYRSEGGARFGSTQRGQVHEIGHREPIRDAVARTAVVRHRVITGAAIENFAPDVEQEVVEEVRPPKRVERSATISGPSFLGLGNEETNSGFVYDDARDGGYVYDSPSETPEYLLTEVSRGVSWRAWALFLLLLIGAGLGYIQWRASQHQGPDLAAILSGNGAILDPNHPVVDNNHTKPPAQKGTDAPDSSQADNAKGAESAKKADQEDSADADVSASAPSTESSESKAASTESGKKLDSAEKQNAEAASTDSGTTASAKKVTAKNEDAEATESASKVADEPAASTKRGKSIQNEEEPAKPKSLGEKDPLIIQADKYIRGRGVRQNCSMGVNLLREAVSAGNPEASVKIGALYWSGTCVTQSKVTAYQWFSRAHSLAPTNRWIERSRNSLWASLSPQERQRVGY